MDTLLSRASFRCDNEFGFWFEMIFKVTEFPSVNNLHGINTRTKVVYDMPWVTQFRQEMMDQIIMTDPRSKCPWIDEDQVFAIHLNFVINRDFFRRDCDNMIKVPQDCIARALGINDSHIIEVHSRKSFREGMYEYLIVRFGISNYNYIF